MAIIVYDLDHTLIDADCSELWLQYLIDTGQAGTQLIEEAERQRQQYMNGTLDMQDYLKMILKTHIGQTPDEATAGIDDFIRDYVVPAIRTDALANIQQHQASGDRCVVISASVDFLVKPIAKFLGIEDAIGVQIETRAGLITGAGHEVICYQEGKVFFYTQWLREQNESAAGSWFYSDSHNDLPLLEHVDNPVAVTPDPQLLAVSDARNWQVMHWQ